MSLPTPRHYQQKAINLMRKAYIDGKRKILLWLATGGGKSVIFLIFISTLLMNKKKVCFVVKRKQLVLQAQRHFQKAGIQSSIVMANSKGFDPHANFQICSIDTITRRNLDFLQDYDFVIVDEAHDSVSPSYVNFFDICQTVLKVKCFIGLTATPFPVGNIVHSFWDSCVKPIEMHELMEMGFLVDCDLYRPDEIDLSEVKITGGDYDSKQLSAKMRDMTIIGDTLELYNKYGNNLPALCFCVDKDHSMRIAEEFNRAGIRAIHCDESTPQDERDEAIKMLQNHLKMEKPFVLCNVNIFSTGVDIPEAIVGIFARPTKSENLWIQQAGRLFRPCRICGKCDSQYDNSDNCPVCGYDKPKFIKLKAVLIDQGHNSKYLGHPYLVRYPALTKEDVKKRAEAGIPLAKTCRNCYAHYPVELKKCPLCTGAETREKFYETKEGEFRLYNEYEQIKKTFTDLQRIQLETGKKPNWKFFQMYKTYGDTVMKYKDEFSIPSWVPKLYAKSQEEKLEGMIYK